MDFKNARQQNRKEFFSRKEEPTSLDPQNDSHAQYESLVLKRPATIPIIYIGIAIVFIIYLLLPGTSSGLSIAQMLKSNLVWGLVLPLLPIVFLIMGIRGLLGRKQQLIIDNSGIRTNEATFGWGEITETKFRFLSGKTILLIVKTETTENQIDNGNFNVSPRFLGHHIELIKARRLKTG